MINEEFDKKLLESQNPFPYPQSPRRPSFIVGGDQYLKNFRNTYNNVTKQEGTLGVFIVGMPGAGKTRFLLHLDYLFYEKGDFKGIYAVHTLSDLDINEEEREIWKRLFLSPDPANRLASLIPKEKIELAEVRPDIKVNLLKLIDQDIKPETRAMHMDSLTTGDIRRVAEHVSNLLPEDSIICFALDNVEEYLRYREESLKSPIANSVELLFEKIRNMTSNLRRALVLLALTDDAWAKVKTAEPARTKARRFKFAEEEQVLGPLTLPDCYRLVQKNMKLWCDKNNVSLPANDKDCLWISSTETVSLYPFTPLAIEMARRVTDGLAGDITCFCSECIAGMRNDGKVEVVKDELIIENLLKTSREWNWLGWAPRARRELEELGPIIKEKMLTRKLQNLVENTREKYKTGIETETIVGAIDRFAEILGVAVSPAPRVPNSYNPNLKAIEPSPILKIWSFQETKVAVRYVIGEAHLHIPSVSLYGKRVSLQDYVDVMSLIDDQKATHGLMILLWAVEDQLRLPIGFARSLREFGNTIMTMDIKDDDLFKIIAVAEAIEDQKDLARFVDRVLKIDLIESLKVLVQQQRPVEKIGEKPKTEAYTRYY